MRKLFSLLTAVLFAGSMMAGVESVDFSAQGYENQQAIESYAGTNFTVTFGKGTNSNAPKYYTSGTAIRCYGANTFTVASESTISQIVLTYGTGDGSNEITAAPGTFATNTWTGSANSVVFTIGGTSGNRRIQGIAVTFDGEGGGVQPVDTTSTDTVPVVPPVVSDTLTCAAAAELALAGNTDEHVIKGYVTEIATPWSSQYSNISFWMADAVDGGQVFQGYRIACATEAEAPVVGDLVWIKGNLKKYNDIAETNAGGTFGILARAEVQPTDTTVVPVDTTVVPVDTTVTPVTGDVESVDFSAQGYTNQQAIESYAGTNFSVTFDKGTNSNAPKYYTSGTAIRCYGANTFTVASPKTIIKIVLTFGASDGSNEITATPGAFATDTWTGSANSVLFTIGGTSGNRRIQGIAVTFDGEGGGVQPVDTTSTDTVPVVPPVVGDTLTCAAAAELALAGNTDEHVIKGYVTEIATPWSSQYSNISFWMADAVDGGQVFQGYRIACATEAEAPVVGDLVWIKGNLKKYNDIAETNAGGTFGILAKSTVPVVEPVNLGEKTIAEFLELKNTKDTCILTGIIANVANTQYGNFDLVELGNAEVKVYVYGLLTAAGETKKCFEEEGLAEGDTLKVKAIYTTYNNNPQVKNAIFVEVKKAGGTPAGIEITIADGTFVDYVADEGIWLVEAQNEDYYISLSNDNDQITQAAGTYAYSDLYAADSYILTETDSISFIGGSIVLAVDAEGVATITGSLEGSDNNTYILNIVCPVPEIPTAESTVDVTITDGVLEADEGGFWAYGGDDAFVQLFIKSATVAGQYTEADIDMNESAIFFSETEYTDIYSATLTIVASGKGVYVLTGSILCYNNTQYNVSMILTEDIGTGIEETLAAGKAAKVLRNGQVRILKADKTFDVTGARIR